MSKVSKEERHLRDLLALIFEDGGETNAELGLDEAVKKARQVVTQLHKISSLSEELIQKFNEVQLDGYDSRS